MALVIFGKTVDAVTSKVDQQGAELRAELERGTARLTAALIVVGALAAFAVVVAVSQGSTTK